MTQTAMGERGGGGGRGERRRRRRRRTSNVAGSTHLGSSRVSRHPAESQVGGSPTTTRHPLRWVTAESSGVTTSEIYPTLARQSFFFPPTRLVTP